MTFEKYFTSFEKMQSWIIKDLRLSTINAQANFLVAMGLFNYIELLGSFSSNFKSEWQRFKDVLTNLFPDEYKTVYDDLGSLTAEYNSANKLIAGGATTV